MASKQLNTRQTARQTTNCRRNSGKTRASAMEDSILGIRSKPTTASGAAWMSKNELSQEVETVLNILDEQVARSSLCDETRTASGALRRRRRDPSLDALKKAIEQACE